MAEISLPKDMDSRYSAILRSCKADFVDDTDSGATIAQFGATKVAGASRPGWPDLTSAEPVFETYVVGATEVTATSDHQPFVDAWLPLVAWLNDAVRSELHRHGTTIEGDAYVTASLSASAVLEGVAHMDDDSFVPTDNVGAVAIIGQHVGPRIATGSLATGPLRPMGQVVFGDTVLGDFAADKIAHCQAAPDEIVIFPQFGQLHAGPATEHLVEFSSRQLLVLRARVATDRTGSQSRE